MFKSYQALILGYADFFSNSYIQDYQKQNDQQILNLNSTSNLDRVQQVVNGKQNAIDYIITSSNSQSDGVPTLGSKQIDKNGNEIIIGAFNGLTANDVMCVLVILINLIFAKRYLVSKLRSSNFLKMLGLRQKDRDRMEESLWRLIYYTFSSIWLVYTCFLKREATSGLYLDANHIFSEYSFTIDLDEYLICMIEVGFYLHATYALIFEDVWRRDSPMMLLHHVAATFSVMSFYATRIHHMGLTAVVLRDTCDVLLEVTKLAMCFRLQHGRVIRHLELSVKFFMTIFTATFVINQLYYYPLFCLYHALNIVKIHRFYTPVMTGILTCALIFLILDLFWFLLIIRLLYRMFSSEPLKDLREYEDLDEELDIAPTTSSYKSNGKQFVKKLV